MRRVTFSIRGTPPAAWSNNEWEWRRAVAQAARQHRQTDGDVAVARFSVSIVFHMASGSLDRSDLDNLVKPVLDTLFRSRNAQVKDPDLTGALFEVDDDRVFKLTLEKRIAQSRKTEGADISVDW